MSENLTRCYSFPPIAATSAKILILGSMPGAESLRQQQYYAHPRNGFWPIMQSLFAISTSLPYQQRCEQLTHQHIAVWDVLKACERPGSLDSNIASNSIEANDFNAFFQAHPKVQAVFFNGAKAEQIYMKSVLPTLDKIRQKIPTERLPSTSPAHAVLSLEEKQTIWHEQLSSVKTTKQ